MLRLLSNYFPIYFLSDLADDTLGDDDVFVLESIAKAKKNDEEKLRVTLIITFKDNLLSISKIIKIVEVGLLLFLHFSKFYIFHIVRRI